MAEPVLLQEQFALGMKRDVPRNHLPDGASWEMVDFIPERDYPLRKRGPIKYASDQATTPGFLAGGAFAEFAAGSKIVVWDESGTRAWSVNLSTGALTLLTNSIGGAIPLTPGVFYREKLYVPSADGTADPVSVWDGGGAGFVNIAAAAPPAKHVDTYKDHLVAAGWGAFPNRVAYSKGGDASTWNNPTVPAGTAGGYQEMTRKVTGIKAMKNMILVFEEGLIERVRGDIIPGVSGSDFVREPLFPLGVPETFASATVTWNEMAIFTNQSGVFMTDGIALVDLTKVGGVKRYWQSLFTGQSVFRVTAGVYQDLYHVVAVNNSAQVILGLVCDLNTKSWWRMTFPPTTMMFSTPSGRTDVDENLYSNHLTQDRLLKYSNVYTSTARTDDDGYSIIPGYSTAFYRAQPGPKTAKNMHITYDLRDSVAGASLFVLVSKDPGDFVGSSLGFLSETTGFTRAEMRLSKEIDGMAVILTPSAVCDDLIIYSIEAEINQQERSR